MNSSYDLVGPVLPQALRLARYQASTNLPQNVKDVQSENDTINKSPSREEERLLASNANVMTALEDLFSWREKDRTCRKSKLSRMESVRFQRAMYRIWLMSVLFGPRRFVPTLGLPDEELKKRDPQLQKSWKDQKAFLQKFSTQELFQIDRLARFVISTAQWAVTASETGLGLIQDAYDWTGMFLFAGPHSVLRCYEDATVTHLPIEYRDDDGPYTKFLRKPLSEIVKERHVTAPIGSLGVILDSIHGEHDRCHHCGGGGVGILIPGLRTLPDLYNETNWDDLKGKLDREFLIPRNLCLNSTEQPLGQALNGDWPILIREMLACKSDEYTKWSEGDWICAECWSSFFWDTLWRWRLEQKKKAEESIEADCRYGYGCREQCYDTGSAHAKQFNHLCKPMDPNEPIYWE